ncbi:hypothetical protein UVI_02050760 [Ustilaginoidea virens]|uniref:Uncharacterized protein n=1 Tax=Ustilaginoidea virens TaxID=1159556 RepID=A0A1B5L2B3_USTVR|nr:hypothetical protein UVI_02050760 [Ustilaginoidea virens]
MLLTSSVVAGVARLVNEAGVVGVGEEGLKLGNGNGQGPKGEPRVTGRPMHIASAASAAAAAAAAAAIVVDEMLSPRSGGEENGG